MFAAILFVACNDKIVDSGTEINLGPEITFDESTVPALSSGDSLTLTVTAEDPDGVAEVKLYHRQTGAQFWENIIMSESDNGFIGTVESVSVPGIDFYFRATDSGNPIAYSIYPVDGAENPFTIPVNPVALPLPFEEDFELVEGQSSLLDRDWWTPSDSRDTFAFALSQSQSQSGQLSVFHPRGSADVPEIGDWLISPPLNLSTVDNAMVSWWERVSSAEVSNHSLWISTGERLPEDGDYVQVSTLEPIGIGEWTRYRYIDLSDFAGEELVYLAWRWEGTLADDWYIDDVEVRALGPDIITQLSVVAPETPLTPGDSISIEITIDNLTSGIGDNLAMSLSLPEGGGQFENENPEIPTIESNGSVTVQATLNLDLEVAENRYLPIAVAISDDSAQWEDTHNILIGTVSLFDAELSLNEPGEVEVILGVGDPDNPTWSFEVWSDDLDQGTQNIQLDVTDQFALLPPQPGSNRWFVQIESEVGLTVLTSTLNYGDQVYAAQENTVIYPSFPEQIFIPEPPAFTLFSQSPSSSSPGDNSLPISLYIQNSGADTQGEVTATISSQDPAVSIDNDQPISLGEWPAQSYKLIDGPLLSISDTQTSSEPVSLTLQLSDSVEAWSIPFEVAVPWPVMKVVQVQIMDGNDGILVAGEDAQLEITVANIGGRSAFGVVSGTLETLPSGAAAADVTNDNPSYGFLSANDVDESDDFFVNNVTGSDGDSLQFQLTLNDGSYSYMDTFEVVLGEPPWLSLSPFNDTVGDSVSETAIDIERVEYRLEDGDTLSLRVHSATPIDQQTAFIEAWGLSGGADYTYFRWVVQSGVGTLQGYNSGAGFMTIGDVDVVFSSATEVELRWPVEAMGLAQNTIDIGLASGWCGPPTYYCDHYPDGWGYPYVTFIAGLWYNISF